MTAMIRKQFGAALATCLLAGLAATAGAQTYAITKFTIDGGGGESSGGKYLVKGTIGQPDASGVSKGGRYTVSGGYWAGLVNIVRTAGAPELRIMKSGKSTVMLSWKDPSDAWVLQQSETLKAADWKTSNLQITIVNGEKHVLVNRPSRPQYFRLRRKGA